MLHGLIRINLNPPLFNLKRGDIKMPITKSVICISDNSNIKRIDFIKKPGNMVITLDDGSTSTYRYELVGVFQ